MKVEQIQSDKVQRIRNGLFLAAYSIWMLRAFFNTTYFYSAPLFVRFEEYALNVSVFLGLLCLVPDFEFRIKEIAGVFLGCLLFWCAYANGSQGVAVSVVLICAARRVPFRKIAKWTVVMLGCLLTFVVVSSLLGVVENHVFVQEGGRTRYGLGFLYCSYASHYLLLFFMLYFVLRKQVRLYEVGLLLVLNIAGYAVTDTKTDMISLAMMLAVMLVLKGFEKKERIRRWISYLAFLVPFFFCGVSMFVGQMYRSDSPVWQKMDAVLNNRLWLSAQALEIYPIPLFGQKIKWVGGSAKLKNPDLVYNYVDNNYITVVLQMGVLFAFFMCLFYGRAAYAAIRDGKIALAAALIVFMVVGLVNPEMRNLLYNTFILVLAKKDMLC